MSDKRERLDVLCVARGLCPTRQRARALILAGQVLVDGQVQTKAGVTLSSSSSVALREPDHPFVSRGGLKLQAALVAFALEVREQIALDIGASTGGFSDCLLQHGARHIIAVDVGYGQLAWKLRQDPRLTCLERTNARYLEASTLQAALPSADLWPPQLAVVDVSFISLTLILPALARVLGPCTPIVALVKPQFEAGRNEVGKGGVVRDPARRERAIRRVTSWAEQQGFRLQGELDSPVAGPRGNVERLVLLITP